MFFSRLMDLITHNLTVIIKINNLKSLINFSNPTLSIALQLLINIITLYLNKFRRKLAISKFDWLFTPNQKSSQHFALYTGSVLKKLIYQPVFG